MDDNKVRDEDSGRYTEKFDIRRWKDVVEELSSESDTQTVSTTEVHRKIEEELGADSPTWRTTHSKLEKLAEEGEIASEKVGNTMVWWAKKPKEKRVMEVVREYGPATTKALSESIDLDEEELENVLQKLKTDGKVDSEIMGTKVVWLIE